MRGAGVRRVLPAVVLAGVVLCRPSAAGAPVAVRVVHEAAVCDGQTLVVGPHRLSCVHAAPDAPTAAPATLAPARGPVVCFGDGTTGPRVQVLYAYARGRPDRSAAAADLLRQEVAAEMQGVVSAASGGRDLAIRFAFTPGCGALSMPVVQVPVLRGSPEDQLGQVVDALVGLGYTRTDRKYQVWLDSSTSTSVCGLGELAPQTDQPPPANLHDGVPTAGARTDVASTAGLGTVVPVPRYSVVFHHALGPRGPDCWRQGKSRAMVQVHELFHTLGAVQLSAPHSDGGGHCTDVPSVMCPNGKPTVPACARAPVDVLDCGLDDYWNPAPASGSYLERADNIAASPFFGPQPQDRLAALPF